MAGFLVLYRAPASAREHMANVTPEQAQAGMDLWRTWAGRAGDAIVDLGAPLGNPATVGQGDAYGDLAGYSILEAASRDAVMGLLHDHPHFHTRGARWRCTRCCPCPAPDPRKAVRIRRPAGCPQSLMERPRRLETRLQAG